MYTNSVKHIRIQKGSKNLYNTKNCSTFAKSYFNNTMEYEKRKRMDQSYTGGKRPHRVHQELQQVFSRRLP